MRNRAGLIFAVALLSAPLTAARAQDAKPIPKVTQPAPAVLYDFRALSRQAENLIPAGYDCAPSGRRGVTAFAWNGACAGGLFDGKGESELVPPGGGTVLIDATFARGAIEGPAMITFKDGATMTAAFHAGAADGAVHIVTPQGVLIDGTVRAGYWTDAVAIAYLDGTHARYDTGGEYWSGWPAQENSPSALTQTVPVREGQAFDRAFLIGDGSALTIHPLDDRPAIYSDRRGRRFVGAFRAARPVPETFELDFYPPLARRLNEQGSASLSFIIGADGLVSDVRLRESSTFERLDGAAMAFAARWRYEPATVGSHAIATFATAVVTFDAPPMAQTIVYSPLAVPAVR